MQSGEDQDATATGLFVHADLPAGSVLAGRYRIEKMLGVGGMGMVYRAADLALGVTVALKLLRPELMHRSDALERFRQELLLARQVSSPRVVRIHDLAQHDGRWVISMDFVDGETLDRRLDREGPLPVEDAVRIARQLAEGLAAAHGKGVIHRDLKPANVLLDAQGDAYISDFGVARSLAAGGATRTGAVIGTPDYLSPEQARGDPVDARSDLYALGLILYEMLSGKLPFHGGTMGEVLAQRMLRSPGPIEHERQDVPAWLARLVDRLLRPQPAHRLQSAQAVLAAIEQRAVPRQFRRDQWLRAGAWTAAWLAIGLMVAGGWWWSRRPGPAAVPAAPPLERTLVLPITGPGLPGDRATALTASLRDALAAAPGVAIVDGERSEQALRQLDAAGNAPPDPDMLRRVAAARDVLQLRLVPVGRGLRVQAALLDGAAGPRWAGPAAAGAVPALRQWLASPATRQHLHLRAPATLELPASDAALEAYGAGLAALREGRLSDALAQFQAATRAAPEDGAAWLAQAGAALAIGEQDAAWDALERGAQARATPRVRRQLAAARALVAGDAPAAVAQWRALLAGSPGDTEVELQLARALGAGGEFKTAIQRLQALAKRDGSDPRVWFELGKFSILQGEARRAVDDYLVRALVLFKRSRNLYGEAETVNALGVGYGRLGQTADAAEQYRKAVQLRRALGNRRGEATSLRNLANVLSLTGHDEEASRRLGEARAINQSLGDRAGLAAVDNELGLLREERGDYRGALSSFRDALQSWRQAEDPHGTADALNNIGFAHFQLGAYDDAQAYWQQAADAYEALGEGTGRVRVQQNLGLLATARGRWKEARRLLSDSLVRAERLQMPEEAAVSRRNLAELELLQGHVGAAIDQAQRAGALFRAREDVRGQSDVGLLEVQALLAAHADAEAAALLERLAPSLRQGSVEQRAIAAIARAELATRSGRAAQAAQALREAGQLAAGSGVRQLQLQAALRQSAAGRFVPALGAQAAALGNATLRLAWLEQALRHALREGDAAAAAGHYREAAQVLRNGDALRAAALHALGAQALATGDAAGARVAAAKAAQARATLRTGLPPRLRAGFDAATARADADAAP